MRILFLRAALKVNLMSTSTIWHQERSSDLFSASVLHSRFKFINCFITFNDKASRTECWITDKFACVRETFELMNVGNTKCRYPSPILSFDETLYQYRGSIGFNQYSPDKPVKFGLLFRSLCDSTTMYTYYTLPYAGKPEVPEGNAAKYYVTGTDAYTQYLVNEISNYSSIQGGNISLDRYFTFVSLAKWALEKKFTIEGTMRHDRKEIPKELKSANDREEKSALYVYHKEKDVMLVSYINNMKSGKKNVIVLTTLHDSVKVTND